MTFFDADGSGQALPYCGTGGRQYEWFRIIYRPCALKLEAFSPWAFTKKIGPFLGGLPPSVLFEIISDWL
jgi:hypothetical protein